MKILVKKILKISVVILITTGTLSGCLPIPNVIYDEDCLIFKNIPYSEEIVIPEIPEVDMKNIHRLEEEIKKNPDLAKINGLMEMIEKSKDPSKSFFTSPRILDLYTTRDVFLSNEQRPAIMIIHGGTWIGGDKSEKDMINAAKYLVHKGYIVVSINYRLAPLDGTWPIMIDDCALALDWMRQGEFNINSDKIGVIGISAGGHLSSLLSVSEETRNKIACNISFFGPANIPQSIGYEGERCLISNIIQETPFLKELFEQMIFGTTYKDNKDFFFEISPFHIIPEEEMSPTFLYHGLKDPIIHWSQSEAYHNKLIAMGHYSELIIDPEGDHNFPKVFFEEGGELFERFNNFLNLHLKG